MASCSYCARFPQTVADLIHTPPDATRQFCRVKSGDVNQAFRFLICTQPALTMFNCNSSSVNHSYINRELLRQLGNVVAVVLKRRRQLVNERDVVGLVCHT